jgi:hypothetical protein
MAYAIRIHAAGGPEALVYEEVSLPTPGAGEARVRHTAIGVNFIDTYHRSGLYPLPLPSSIGSEGCRRCRGRRQRRRLGEARRSRCLLRRRGGRVFDRARDAGRSTRQAAGRHRRP